MAVTKQDILAELARRQGSAQQPQAQEQPQPSLGQRALGAAEDTLPYLGGAAGAFAGTAAAPVVGPAAPFLGAGLGYGAVKSGFRGLRQAMGEQPQESLIQGLGSASKDVAAGTGMELAPQALLKGAQMGIKGAGKMAGNVLPGLLQATANVPQEATKYALEHPGEVLSMAEPEAKAAISRGVSYAHDTYNKFLESQKVANQQKLSGISKRIGERMQSAMGTLGGIVDEAKMAMGARAQAGVSPTREQEIDLILGKGKAKAPSIDNVLKEFQYIRTNVSKMDPMAAFNKLLEIDDGLGSAISKSKDDAAGVAFNGLRSQVKDMIGRLPIESKVKAEEIGYRSGLKTGRALLRRFDNPLNRASGEEVTKMVNFLENNAHRLEPREAYRMALSTRKAIDSQLPKEITERAPAFLADQRQRISGIMEKIPGLDNLKSLDASYKAAADMERMLGDVVNSPTKMRNFLDRAFSGEDPNSQKMMEGLMALEKKSGKPLISDLHKLWEEKNVVENAKFPFTEEFSDPGNTEKFLHGLFVNGGKGGGSHTADARYKLEQVKKILGTQQVDDLFKAFAADAFSNGGMRAYVANRVFGVGAGAAAMLPFTGWKGVAPYVGGTAAIASLGSPQIMKGAIKGAAGIGGAVNAAASALKPGVLMQGLTALKALQMRRKMEGK